MDPHFSINKVLRPTWLGRIKNRNSYQSLLHLLAKRASQPPSYLRSIIHIEQILPHSHFEQVIDTGARSHMTNNLDLFINFETVKSTVRLVLRGS